MVDSYPTIYQGHHNPSDRLETRWYNHKCFLVSLPGHVPTIPKSMWTWVFFGWLVLAVLAPPRTNISQSNKNIIRYHGRIYSLEKYLVPLMDISGLAMFAWGTQQYMWSILGVAKLPTRGFKKIVSEKMTSNKTCDQRGLY